MEAIQESIEYLGQRIEEKLPPQFRGLGIKIAEMEALGAVEDLHLLFEIDDTKLPNWVWAHLEADVVTNLRRM